MEQINGQRYSHFKCPIFCVCIREALDFPNGSVVKNLTAKAGNVSLIPHVKERRKWQPTPVFMPEKSHGQRNLEHYSPKGLKESDRTKD